MMIMKEEKATVTATEQLKRFEFYVDDLKDEVKTEFIRFLGGDNGNHDVVPLCSYETVCEGGDCNNCEWECTNDEGSAD
jgi:hypothetical protein